MKRYIVSATLEDKRNRKNPYLYFTKHGIGPGTLPGDVELVKYDDLDGYMTAIWIDRPLSSVEINKYDIYPESMNASFKKMYDIEASAGSDDYNMEEHTPNDCIDVFRPGSKEYNRLEMVATMLNYYADKDQYYVGVTYYDYGQDWKWTTILERDTGHGMGDVQILSPRLQQEVLNAHDLTKLAKAAEDVMNR